MTSQERYINNVTAEHFGFKEVTDPYIPITKEGWYWADKDDNHRYEDFSGPFLTEQGAIVAGKNHRRNAIRNNFK